MAGFGSSFGQPQNNLFGGGGGGFGSNPTPFGSGTPLGSSGAFGGGGGGGGGGLFGGQQQAQGFGSFGQQNSAFGASSTPFGAPASGFGASSSGFGASNPTFGVSSSLFGTSAPGFGAASWSGGGFGVSSSAFGATATPFGASSSSFGGSSLFGNTQSSSSLFGGNSNAAFGSTAFNQSQSLFASSSSFGGASFSSSSLFGASSSSLFENNAGGAFGAATSMQPRVGTAGVTWQLTVEYEGNPSNQLKYNAIPMMPDFRDKSMEELRYEDYASGNKDGSKSGSNPPNSLFANNAQSAPSTGLFGSTSGGFGQSNAFGGSSGQSLFGAPNSSPGLFSGGTLGASNTAQSGSGLFSGNNAFGSQPSANLFGGQSGGGFGQSSGGLFGGNLGSGFGQSSSGAFGQGSGAFGAFGAPSSQPQGFGQAPQQNSLFGAPQSGASTGFGQPPQSGQNLFGSTTFGNGGGGGGIGGGSGGGGLFGGGGSAQHPPMFGNPAANAQPTQPGGLFGTFGNNYSGFGAPSAGQGFGTGFSSTPGGNLPQQNGFGGFMAQNTTPLVAGTGSNPTLVDSYNAVVNNGGATAAPPGASYATVLYNLQLIQKDLQEHKQRSVAQEQEKKDKESLSVVVMPAPSLVRIASNRLSLCGPVVASHDTPTNGEVGITRTPMRGMANNGMVSGTPYPRPCANAYEPPTPGSETKVPVDRSETMPFFTPQQFSGAKRRPLRASEIGTPRIGYLENSEKEGTARRVSFGGVPSPKEEKENENSGEPHSDEEGEKEPETPNKPVETPTVNGRSVKGEVEEDQDQARRDSSNFLWSGKRPSQWSKNRGLTSDDQYNPCQYVPVCARSDYYTIPSQAELSALSMLELQHVERFTVGRIGYGEIEWIEPMDVRGLLINECVEIERGEFAVFPDREASQLDAPAKVTLEGMFPKRKNGESDYDAAVERYRSKLKKFCDRNGFLFGSYDGDKGVWSFSVDSFSE